MKKKKILITKKYLISYTEIINNTNIFICAIKKKSIFFIIRYLHKRFCIKTKC